MLAEPKDNIRAVNRALDILQSFSRDTSKLSVVDLQKRTKISRPTLYRLLSTLTGRGFIRSEGDPQRFHLGPEIARLAEVWSAHVDVVQLARPILNELWRETGETVALFALRNETLFCLAELASRQPLSISRGVGPLAQHPSQGASGKIIMAHLPPSDLDGMANGLPPGVTPTALHAALAKLREAGVAVTHGEVIAGAVAIAAPVFDCKGEIAASLALFGPAVRVNKTTADRLAKKVREAARFLSNELGSAQGERG